MHLSRSVVISLAQISLILSPFRWGGIWGIQHRAWHTWLPVPSTLLLHTTPRRRISPWLREQLPEAYMHSGCVNRTFFFFVLAAWADSLQDHFMLVGPPSNPANLTDSDDVNSIFNKIVKGGNADVTVCVAHFFFCCLSTHWYSFYRRLQLVARQSVSCLVLTRVRRTSRRASFSSQLDRYSSF